ncbi:MAG: DUF6495 family protein [Cryomorphaceae bacterium]|jgi:hypothetical protein|nr:DUF6495 family protein [Cryomorphaceae bacterium]
MKYRMLTEEELSHFSEELKHFLIVNGIHAEEWEIMNRKNPEKACELVGIFSDTVLQRVYENINYLEFRSTDSCLLFYLAEDTIELVSLQAKPGGQADLSTPEGIHDALVHGTSSLSFFKTTKAYNAPREEEVHRFIEQGCIPSSKEFWDKMQEALQ